MAEEFTDDDFEDLPPAPAPVKRVIKPTAAAPARPVAQAPQPAPAPAPATRDVAAPTEKYGLYSIPPRMGIYDNELQRPVIEESELTSVLLSLLIKVANDVDEIKGRL